MRTLIGWVINGPLSGNSVQQCGNGYSSVNVNRIGVDNLEELLLKQYNHDFSETFFDDKEEMSVEERKFIEIMKNSVQLKDGHYQIKLPFKPSCVHMPNNLSVAQQRIKGLKKKLQKDSEFHREYSNFLSDVINKGYAEKVPECQLERSDGKIWYLPHHGVHHPQTGTLRVVFDCGAVLKVNH